MSCDDHVKQAPGVAGTGSQAAWPAEIILNQRRRTLELVWDGTRATITHKVLRRSCRCSGCESTRRKLNDILPVASEVELLKIQAIGSVGVQLFFSDQHDRGIYPWAYLHQIAFGATDTGFAESLTKGWSDE